MQCEEWADANSELFKEDSYKRKLYELISASLAAAFSFHRYGSPLPHE